ncbi:F-type H+-transporting ATPase subunit epsilon [Nitrosomonas aestuarii]|uniref:F-type H+-transporting ATPase subunit epsilon n=1 Tax=Nitrosomonas aestuarii TaxID=52441 RepID=A0A1I4D0F0_9PROT|nr:F0F1 ATP synthase subunit epsilon [Nitrosomonas aestuarii]SFK86615.1 F-type H+-transporting ATPase subunit epsilon [Nitrosomonas aestuarii]
MKTFILHIQSATQYTPVTNVTSFVGADPSGSFGILAGHARFMTALNYGLARYQLHDNSWCYLAFPGGILYFLDNHLYISSRRFLSDTDYQRISAGLLEQLLAEETELKKLQDSLCQLEQEMFRRLWQMERNGTHL